MNFIPSPSSLVSCLSSPVSRLSSNVMGGSARGASVGRNSRAPPHHVVILHNLSGTPAADFLCILLIFQFVIDKIRILYYSMFAGFPDYMKGVAVMAESTMSTFLTNVGTFFTQAVAWLGDILDVITENPALTVLVIAMPIVGFAVGLLGRLIRL